MSKNTKSTSNVTVSLAIAGILGFAAWIVASNKTDKPEEQRTVADDILEAHMKARREVAREASKADVGPHCASIISSINYK